VGLGALTLSRHPILAELYGLLARPLLVVLIVVPLWRAIAAGLLEQIGGNPTLSFMLAGSFAIHMWTRPGRWESASAVLLALALKLCHAAFYGTPTYFAAPLVSFGSFLGIASLAVLLVQTLRLRGDARPAKTATLGACAVLPFTWIFLREFLIAGIRLRPRTWDLFLYCADGSLGFQPSFWLGRLLSQRPLLTDLTWVVYWSLPLAVSAVYASQRMTPRHPVKMLPQYVSMMIVGFCLYAAFPGTGPVYIFPAAFPHDPPALLPALVGPIPLGTVPRNAMPSLHIAGALLAYWNSRQWPRLARGILLLFLLWTAFATLASGEHYLVDLVVALPFSLAFQAGWSRSLPFRQQRLRLILAGAAVTLAWLILLRFGLAILAWSRLIPLFLISATVAWVWFTEARFSKRAWPATPG
jgi:hypothetical protein